MAYQTYFSFKTALNHCPGPVEAEALFYNKLSSPFSTPLLWSGNNCLSLDPAQGLPYNHITWFENIKLTNLASLSRFRIENQLKRLKLLAV